MLLLRRRMLVNTLWGCVKSARVTGYCNGNSAVLCDWCAQNDHPHFDLDTDTFNTVSCDRSSSQ